jgi:hypothetical protein
MMKENHGIIRLSNLQAYFKPWAFKIIKLDDDIHKLENFNNFPEFI